MALRLARPATRPHIFPMATSKPKVRFEAVERKDGQWYVRLTLPGGRQPQIDGFSSEGEARRWINAQSATWLRVFEGGRYAPERSKHSQ
jgi:hypothetical protein